MFSRLKPGKRTMKFLRLTFLTWLDANNELKFRGKRNVIKFKHPIQTLKVIIKILKTSLGGWAYKKAFDISIQLQLWLNIFLTRFFPKFPPKRIVLICQLDYLSKFLAQKIPDILAKVDHEMFSGVEMSINIRSKLPRLAVFDFRTIYIVTIPQKMRIIPYCYIPFNLEGIRKNYLLDKRTIKILVSADLVFDYSQWNKLELESQLNLKAVFVIPILPIPDSKRKPDDAERFKNRSTKILFYGGVEGSNRRNMAIQRFKLYCPDIKLVANASYQQLREEISHARVVVNVHYYEKGTLETLRISEALSELTPVVSEYSPNALETPLSMIIDTVSYEDFDGLITKALEIANDYDLFHDRQKRILKFMNGLKL